MNATAEIIALSSRTKKCPDCEEIKPASGFYARPTKNGLSTYCRRCNNKRRSTYGREYQNRKWQMLSPAARVVASHKRQLRNLWFKHGLTMDQLRLMLAKQGSLCGNRACGKELSLDVHGKRGYWERAVVDHDHATGKVRGLLCNPCNKAEGFYTKNKNLLFGIAEYLERSSVA